MNSKRKQAVMKKKKDDDYEIAQIIGGSVAVLCAVSKQARVICNTIMVVVPLITTFGYPKEAPPKDDMVIYWGVFGILTLGDKELEKFPFYYDFKLLLALLLFLEPFRLVDKLREIIYSKDSDENRLANRRDKDFYRRKHSPRREKADTSKSGKRGKFFDAKDGGTGEADDASLKHENLFISEKDVDTPAEQSERKPSMSKRELDQTSGRPTSATAAAEADSKKAENSANATASGIATKQEGDGKKQESTTTITATKPKEEGKKEESTTAVTATKPEGEGKKEESTTTITATKPEGGEGKKDDSASTVTATKPDEGKDKKDESTRTAISPAQVGEGNKDESTHTAVSSETDVKKEESTKTARESDTDKPHEKKVDEISYLLTYFVDVIMIVVGFSYHTSNFPLYFASVSYIAIGHTIYRSRASMLKVKEEIEFYLAQALVIYKRSGVDRNREPNPMEHDDFHILREVPGIENVVLDPSVNIHEAIFRPLDRLVFNAPFDFDHVTYHMTLMNNTIHPMAFAIKGNCIPRVIAYPPYGVLKPKQRIPIAVTMRALKFA
ncbi:hypothetical protein DICVIV_04357 [Dictyocaulus viviparus]|uniref:MSP domain-containing protein n=1 Tax=Dictyocaulus viviparus TaxID=29172 RepID=A0A0D8XXY2_DICVI|nr:hypothetical protein DICVIV_04357 [Dictyocaulus viviparus]